MAYKIEPERFFTMPTNFGSPKLLSRLLDRLGPRQIPSGGGQHGVTTVSASFLTQREQLDELLPEGMEVAGEPVLTVACTVLDRLDWLGGHGYNLITVGFRAAFHGTRDRAVGTFLPVVWENMCEPILAGRELLGWSKIFAEIPMPELSEQGATASASWKGFRFLDLEVTNLKPVRPETLPAPPPSDGTLHFKYVPRTGAPGEADAAYVTLCAPSPDQPMALKELRTGDAKVQFHAAARWDQLPTMAHIVGALADLEVRELRGGAVSRTEGGGPGDPRSLR